MADLLTYRISADAPKDADVVERLLTVSVDGQDVSDYAKSAAPDTTEFGEINVLQGAAVVVTLVDVDDAGNKSEPAEFSFVAQDTIPPAQPGSLGVTLVSENTAT